MKSEFIKTSRGIINSDHICTLAPDEDVKDHWIITLSGGDCFWLPEAEAKALAAKLLGLIFSPNEEASQEEQ